MANWKKVDADQLDADMTTVANAIRNRAGTTDQIEFPGGFVSAVESVPDTLADRLNNNIIEYQSDKVTEMVMFGLAGQTNLKKVSLPNFTNCAWYAFYQCSSLEEVYVPKLTNIEQNAFESCPSLKKLDLPSVTMIQPNAFGSSGIETIILRAQQVCAIFTATTINAPAINNGTGYIYVPRSLVDTYKSATNWSNYASQIRAIEDYPDITGG